MKTKDEIKKLVSEVFQNYSISQKKKIIELLSPENRLSVLKDTISTQNNMLDLMEPLAVAEAKKIKKSLYSRQLKQRITMEAIKTVFAEYPNMKKTLGGVWIKLNRLKDKIIYDPVTDQKCNIYIRGDILFIHIDGLKNPLKYTKRSLQRFINDLK